MFFFSKLHILKILMFYSILFQNLFFISLVLLKMTFIYISSLNLNLVKHMDICHVSLRGYKLFNIKNIFNISKTQQ
jgi:hypothetical protein